MGGVLPSGIVIRSSVEMSTFSKKISVGPSLREFRGILTGVPIFEGNAS